MCAGTEIIKATTTKVTVRRAAQGKTLVVPSNHWAGVLDVSKAEIEAGLVMRFPVVGGKAWELTREKAVEYVTTYFPRPKSWVWSQLLRARQWLLDNPQRLKTPRGMSRFLGQWLARAADSSDGREIARAAGQSGREAESDDAERLALIREASKRGKK